MLFTVPPPLPKPQVADPTGGERMGRVHFSTRKWAAQHDLGDPIDVKWFNAHK